MNEWGGFANAKRGRRKGESGAWPGEGGVADQGEVERAKCKLEWCGEMTRVAMSLVLSSCWPFCHDIRSTSTGCIRFRIQDDHGAYAHT